MQATCTQPSVEQIWQVPEEQLVTFQIVLIGNEGLVVGSDRQGIHNMRSEESNEVVLTQSTKQVKYCISDSGSLVCFAAGGSMSPSVAREIALRCDPALEAVKGLSELQWDSNMVQLSNKMPLPYINVVDEIIVIRSDMRHCVWVMQRRPIRNGLFITSTNRITDHICVGSGTAAQFLPRHLWRPDLTISEMKTLALLTLSYAAMENPSTVAAPFDIVSLDRTGKFEFSVTNDLSQVVFQTRLEQVFREQCN